MNEQSIDAECITRNKNYDSKDHLTHLLKIGWGQNSQLIKKFMLENGLTERNLKEALELLGKI